MAIRDRNTWIVLLFVCAGLVIGGLLGEVAAQVDWLRWLAYGQTFGIENPFVLDLNVLSLSGDMKKILFANAQLIPSYQISTVETGTSH